MFGWFKSKPVVLTPRERLFNAVSEANQAMLECRMTERLTFWVERTADGRKTNQVLCITEWDGSHGTQVYP